MNRRDKHWLATLKRVKELGIKHISEARNRDPECKRLYRWLLAQRRAYREHKANESGVERVESDSERGDRTPQTADKLTGGIPPQAQSK